MDAPKPIDLNAERRDKPEQEDIRRIANAAYAHASLAETRAIAVVSILNGGTSYAGAYAGLTREERMALVGELEALKMALLAHDDNRLFEKLPKR